MTTQDTAAEQSYTLANEWEQARVRVGLIETICDPASIRRLEALGVGQGWHCLEVGAGSGSIAQWLCRRVGSSGSVVATDIDTRLLDEVQHPNLQILQHDVTTDVLPEAAFDLVHTRAVLTHLAQRDQVLQRLVTTLKPGGWLCVEELDYVSLVPDPRSPDAALYVKGWAAALQTFHAAGADLYYGRRLYRDLCRAGLVNVSAEGDVPMIYAGAPVARMWQLTFIQLRERIVASGLLTPEEMDRFLALHDEPDFSCMNGILMTAWGRKPLS